MKFRALLVTALLLVFSVETFPQRLRVWCEVHQEWLFQVGPKRKNASGKCFYVFRHEKVTLDGVVAHEENVLCSDVVKQPQVKPLIVWCDVHGEWLRQVGPQRKDANGKCSYRFRHERVTLDGVVAHQFDVPCSSVKRQKGR